MSVSTTAKQAIFLHGPLIRMEGGGASPNEAPIHRWEDPSMVKDDPALRCRILKACGR
jgi:hypothetical protein